MRDAGTRRLFGMERTARRSFPGERARVSGRVPPSSPRPSAGVELELLCRSRISGLDTSVHGPMAAECTSKVAPGRRPCARQTLACGHALIPNVVPPSLLLPRPAARRASAPLARAIARCPVASTLLSTTSRVACRGETAPPPTPPTPRRETCEICSDRHEGQRLARATTLPPAQHPCTG